MSEDSFVKGAVPMKVNIALTAAANLLAALNGDNVGLGASAANVTFGAPSVAVGAGGRNTEVVITAIANQGFSGTKTISYTRQALAAGAAIATAKAVPFGIVAGDTDAQILTKAATALGLIEAELTIADVVQPVDETTNGSANIVAKATSLLYTGTFAAELTVPDADVPLDEAITTSDLTAFEPEA